MATIEPYDSAKGKRYRVRYRKPDGKQTDKRGFRTKKDAEKFANTVEVKKLTGEFIEASAGRVTFSEFAEAWFKGKVNLAPSTRARYRGVLDTHLIPTFGTDHLGDLTHERIQVWITGSAAVMSPASVRKNITVLNQVCAEAVRRRRIAVNPAAEVELPTSVHVEKRYLTVAQVSALAKAAGTVTADPKKVGEKRHAALTEAAASRRVLVYLLAYAGLRFGEAAALRVADVNVLRSRLRIHRSVTQVSGRMVYGAPKNGKARDVAVPKFLLDMLRETIDGKAPETLVFPAANGEPLRLRNVRRDWWNPAVKAAKDSGVPDGFTPHELRHTAASLAIRAGASIKSVQRMLGHSSASLTLDRYGHLFEDELDGVADRLDAHYSAECGQDVGKTLRVAN
ncbi:tyrosine-type recombinase/integrase [Nocardia farcinica]|uniref:tyrosine-type recombinase/integrase n=1 Tax=Nocardia farcinica TaxID=37329 RepID=UPI00189570AF|nr:tyrosine-type recombinase/integrase [Nocardia farcinica]MBF6138691.1 site-specific integrase [Nocardia farcinica]MBF6387230.1 site-specific integrase [Nocardia farcinica]MBF6539498.1 site-specific integrase [Nocardia farcinica]